MTMRKRMYWTAVFMLRARASCTAALKVANRSSHLAWLILISLKPSIMSAM
jgi:hypothetical protein